MADKKIFDDEILDDDQLDAVAGGNPDDRAIVALWVQRYYGSDGTHGQVIDTSNFDISNPADVNSIMANFCAKAGIDYQMNAEGLDQYKINGQWCDAAWLAGNKSYALDYFDKKLGITK